VGLLEESTAVNPYAQLLSAIGGLPDNYLIIDVETNGMSIKDELVLPTQLGYLLAVNRKIEGYGAVIVDWSRVLPNHLKPAFWDKVHRMEQDMASSGLSCKVPARRIRAEGEDPREAWPVYHELLTKSMARGLKVVGFNISAFDRPLLARVGDQMDSPLEFPADSLLDFGVFEKAINDQLELPHPDKGPLAQWYHYARYAYTRNKWNLATHCVAKYGLCCDPAETHGADYDCWINHQLVEAYRALAEDSCPSSTPAHSTPTRSAS
jgi:hypothetical protein